MKRINGPTFLSKDVSDREEGWEVEEIVGVSRKTRVSRCLWRDWRLTQLNKFGNRRRQNSDIGNEPGSGNFESGVNRTYWDRGTRRDFGRVKEGSGFVVVVVEVKSDHLFSALSGLSDQQNPSVWGNSETTVTISEGFYSKITMYKCMCVYIYVHICNRVFQGFNSSRRQCLLSTKMFYIDTTVHRLGVMWIWYVKTTHEL